MDLQRRIRHHWGRMCQWPQDITTCIRTIDFGPNVGRTGRRNAGRICNRYLFQPLHPLHTTHILVPRTKLGIPAFTDNPPPSNSFHLKNKEKKKRYADFYVSSFIPWPATNPVVLSYRTCIEWLNVLEHRACLRRQREPDIPVTVSQAGKLRIQSAKRSRFIAAGRLYDIEICTSCFKTNQEAMVILGKHRAPLSYNMERNKQACI
jgi:hypothetical protein